MTLRRHAGRPTRVADEMLAGDGQTGERLDVARVVRERGEEPALRLGGHFGRDPTLDRSRRPGKTLIDPELATGCRHGTAARLLQDEEVKLSRDLPGNLGLDRFEVFRIKLIPIRPAIFRGHRVADLHVDPERRRDRCVGRFRSRHIRFPDCLAVPDHRTAACSSGDPGERQPAAVAKEIGDEIVGKRFHQVLLIGIAGQVAHRRDSHCNIRQHTRPLQPRSVWRWAPRCRWIAGLAESRSSALGNAAASRCGNAAVRPAAALSPAVPERAISLASAWVSASGATPSSRFRISAQVRYCRSASGRLPACA